MTRQIVSPYVTRAEAARYLRVRRSKVDGLVRAGHVKVRHLPSWAVDGEPRGLIDVRELDELMRAEPEDPAARAVAMVERAREAGGLA